MTLQCHIFSQQLLSNAEFVQSTSENEPYPREVMIFRNVWGTKKAEIFSIWTSAREVFWA